MAGIVWLARTRPVFSPETLREEALLIVCTLGLAVAVLPSVLDGWQAAANLNVQGGERREAGDSGLDAVRGRHVHAARRGLFLVDAAVNLLATLENGLFALGQVLRFPV